MGSFGTFRGHACEPQIVVDLAPAVIPAAAKAFVGGPHLIWTVQRGGTR